jgi:hypothetical protein
MEHQGPRERKLRLADVKGALVEGNSIRSTERMTNTHRDTIMRLMVEVGTGCEKLHNEQMQNLTCKRIQCDEIWSYVKVKQGHIAKGTPRTRIGDQWTFCRYRPGYQAGAVLLGRKADPRQRRGVHV